MPVIGEAAARRHAGPIASPLLWAAICAAAVIVVHTALDRNGFRMGPYMSGILTLLGFLIVAAYSARKRSLWLSARWLRLTSHLPASMQRYFVLADRLETWRRIHITFSIVALLPFWWHLDIGLIGPLEACLATAVAMLFLSGIFGTFVQEFLPRAMRVRPDQEVRPQDVEAKFNAIYVEAEETILGHSEQLVTAYLQNIKPILMGELPSRKFLIATLSGGDPAPEACSAARKPLDTLGGDTPTYRALLDLAQRKIRLEHNDFNLRMSVSWLNFHIAVSIFTFALIFFHVAGVLYFKGL